MVLLFVPSILLRDEDTVIQKPVPSRTAPGALACRLLFAVALVFSRRGTLAPVPIGPMQRPLVVVPAASTPCSNGAAALLQR
jgi:hypothetical protein